MHIQQNQHDAQLFLVLLVVYLLVKCSVHMLILNRGNHISNSTPPLLFKFLGITNPTPLTRISSSRLGRTREKMGKFYSELVFSLPSSFIFSMVTPLHFAHLCHFISYNSSQDIKNLDRILRVSQITLNTEFLHRAHQIDDQVAQVDMPSPQLAYRF
jgi:hypothetical protein